MQRAVESVLRHAAVEKSGLSDWVYVNNFAEPRKPIAIELPAGRALQFRDAMRELIDDLKAALPAVFQSEDYQARHAAIDQAFQAKQADAFSALHEKAAAKGIAILRTPMGLHWPRCTTGKSCRPMNSMPGPRKSATKCRKSFEAWRKSSSRSSARFLVLKWRGGTIFASSTGIPQCLPSVSRSMKSGQNVQIFPGSSTIWRRLAVTWSTTSRCLP